MKQNRTDIKAPNLERAIKFKSKDTTGAQKGWQWKGKRLEGYEYIVKEGRTSPTKKEKILKPHADGP